jgi:hypothetical protein
MFAAELGGVLPLELMTLLDFVEYQRRGKMGRGREQVRAVKRAQPNSRAA